MTNEQTERASTLVALAAAGPVVVDGGMGTLLQDKGLDDGGSGELWNVDRPDAIREAHRAYAEAGARILTTNTFGGTRPRLDMHGLGDRVHELNQAGAALAREVADEHGALVAGDLGPTGELMAPLGTMTADQARAIFAEQLAGLRDGGIDLVLIETMSDLAEVEAAIAAAREVVPDLPIVATLSFDTNLRSMMGVRPGDAVTALAAAGVDAVGANCGRGPVEMAQIAAQLAAARPEGLLLIAQSNAGLPQVVGDHFEYDATPDDMAAHAIELRDLGIDLIGACCGSTPAHVSAISKALSGVSPAPVDGTILGEDGVARCPWAAPPGTMRDYHDTEWGVAVRDERGLFERMCLEGFQAGLSWSTILNKRDRFREVFHDFEVEKVAALTDDDVERLMQDTGIVRNRAKIEATRRNAGATILLRDDGGLEAFLEGFRPDRDPEPRTPGEVPTTSPESIALSKALRKRGFGFVGPTTMHALMEATGLVDTHLVGCHRRGIARG